MPARLVLLTVTLTLVLTSVESSTDAEKHRPQNVVVQVINETTVRVEWTRRKSAELARCPVRRYTVRLRSDDARRSRTWKVDGARRSVTLYGIEPGSSYHVRVLAVVCHGKSKPSQWLGVRTTRAIRHADSDNSMHSEQPIDDQQETSVPGKPSYVRTRTFSDSVMVTWMAPDDGDLVRGYMVGYGEGVPDVNWRYVDASSNNVTIRNLKPATQYIISLRAFNNQGKGQVIYDLIYTRESTGPTMPSPVDLRSKVLSPSTVWLEWNDPTLGRVQQLTDSRYYNVHYRPLMTSAGTGDVLDRQVPGRTLSVVVKAGHVVFYDLRPGTRYEFKVRTVKDAVASAFSETIVNKTFETAPSSPPRAVTVLMNSSVSGTASVNWRPPRLPNGDITGYTVLYTHNPDLSAEQWRMKTVDGPQTQTSLGNLTINVTYHLRVQARNSVGFSPLSSNTVFYTKPIVTPASARSSEVTSSDTAEATALSSSQIASTMASLDEDSDVDQNVTTQQPTAGKTKRDDELPVKVVDNEPSAALPQRASPPGYQVAFTATVQHHVTAFITWSQPCDSDAPTTSVVGYRLRYADAASSTPLEMRLDSSVAAIDGLQASAEYWYQLQYVLDDGTHSPWTEKQLLET